MDMKKHLSNEEVAQVDAWIRQRGFTFEDVRVEILDHVVCAMEDLLKDNPEINLEQAFNKVHASFGVFGFSTMEEALCTSIEKRIRRQLMRQLLSFLKPSGFLLTFSLVLLLITLYQLGSVYLMLSIPLTTTVFFLASRLLIYKNEKSLREHLSFRMAMSYTYFTLPAAFYLLVWLPKLEATFGLQFLSLALATVLVLLEWAQWLVLKAELENYRQKKTSLLGR